MFFFYLMILGSWFFAAFLLLIVPILTIVSFQRTRRIKKRLDDLEHQVALVQSSLSAERPAVAPATATRAATTKGTFTPAAAAKGAVVEAEMVPARQQPKSREKGLSPVTAPSRRLPAAAATTVPDSPRSAARMAEAERWAAAWTAAGPPKEKQPAPPLRSELASEPESESAGAVPSLPSKDRGFTAAEWEMLIGGNWLNRLGVLLILIGLVIFLGYSLTQLGPAGRIAISFVVSLAMLGLGLVYQRRPLFQLFAQGLLGGGWAGVYFTTYAMHAIPASRVISDPAVAAVLLCVVPAGMIAHALWRNSMMGSLLAFLYGVLSILLLSHSQVATLAVLPLLAALLVLSYRVRHWQAPPVAAVALYGVYCWTFAQSSSLSPAFALVPFAAWLVLEVYDVAESIRLRRAAEGQPSHDAALEQARHSLAP